MFEDIYKETDTTSSRHIDYSMDFKEELWEEIKKDPKKLGEVIRDVLNFLGNDIKNHKLIFTDFKFIDKVKKLQFCFKLCDMEDDHQRKTYLDSLDPEERKWYDQ
jgi:hypothetical protein